MYTSGLESYIFSKCVVREGSPIFEQFFGLSWSGPCGNPKLNISLRQGGRDCRTLCCSGPEPRMNFTIFVSWLNDRQRASGFLLFLSCVGNSSNIFLGQPTLSSNFSHLFRSSLIIAVIFSFTKISTK